MGFVAGFRIGPKLFALGAMNPTVQRLVFVANSGEIERIRQEIATMPETFRKSVRFMEVGAAIHAAELIGEPSGIIGTLELVRSEFGV